MLGKDFAVEKQVGEELIAVKMRFQCADVAVILIITQAYGAGHLIHTQAHSLCLHPERTSYQEPQQLLQVFQPPCQSVCLWMGRAQSRLNTTRGYWGVLSLTRSPSLSLSG